MESKEFDLSLVSKDPRLRDLSITTFNTSRETLTSAEGQNALVILPAIRRLAHLYGDNVDTLLLNHRDDIVFDLNSFCGFDVDLSAVEDHIQTLNTLETTFYPLAEQMAKFVRLKDKVYDTDENIFSAQQKVRDYIWLNWQPSEDPIALYAMVKSQFNYGTYWLSRTLPPKVTLAYEEYLDGDVLDIVDTATERVLDHIEEFGEIPPNPQYNTLDLDKPSVENTLAQLQELVAPYTLQEVMTILTYLPFRERRAILAHIGYIPRDTKNYKERQIVNSDFMRAVELLQQTDLPTLLQRSPLAPSIKEITTKVEAQPLYRMGDRVLHFDSPRIVLLESNSLNNTIFLQKLTPKELTILTLALQLEGTLFVNSKAEIGSRLDMAAGTIEETLTRLVRILQSGEPRYIDTAGKVVSNNNALYPLISMYHALSADQLANLSLAQHTVMAYFITPDSSGKYSTIEQAIENGIVTDRNIALNIWSTLSNKELENEIISLRQVLGTALENMELFTRIQQRIIQYTYQQIVEGRPLRNDHGTIDYTAISNALSVDDPSVKEFFEEILPKRIQQHFTKYHDEDLVLQSQNGNKEAFGILYKRYEKRIYKFIKHRVGNSHDTEDLTAIVFVKAFAKIHTFASKGPFIGWLFRITHNLVAEFLRLRREVTSLDIYNDTEEEDKDPDAENPTDQLEQFVTSKILMEALQKLPPEQKNALILSFNDGLSNQEIAKIMGKTEGAIKQLKHRGLTALKADLDVIYLKES